MIYLRDKSHHQNGCHCEEKTPLIWFIYGKKSHHWTDRLWEGQSPDWKKSHHWNDRQSEEKLPQYYPLVSIKKAWQTMKKQIIVRENRSLNICSTKRSCGSSKRRELYWVPGDPSELKLTEKYWVPGDGIPGWRILSNVDPSGDDWWWLVAETVQ